MLSRKNELAERTAAVSIKILVRPKELSDLHYLSFLLFLSVLSVDIMLCSILIVYTIMMTALWIKQF